MVFSSEQQSFLVTLVREYKKGKLQKKAKEDYNIFTERACLAYLTNFSVARSIDMDDAEYLWVLEQHKKVCLSH